MKKNILGLAFVVVTFSGCNATKPPVIGDLGVSFGDSFGSKNYSEIRWCLRDSQEPAWYKRLESRYERCKPTHRVASPVPYIPKIIHQIWLGSPFPEKYQEWQQSWLRGHPDWQYRLWTDADIAQLGLKNQAAYDASTNYGQKSDIARYEILERFGGMYVDVDFECVMPFDALVHRYSFFAGISNGVGGFEINCAVVACAAHHPIMQACVNNLSIAPVHEYIVPNVAGSTGPGYFTRQIMVFEDGLDDGLIVFPSSYFYPLPYNQRLDLKKPEYLRPESFAIHHWGHSWVSQEHYPAGKCSCEDCIAKRVAAGAQMQAAAERRYALLPKDQQL